MPAIVAVIAKVMILIDWMMENFVVVWPLPEACNTYAVQGMILPCGMELAMTLEGIILAGANMLNMILGALGVTPV